MAYSKIKQITLKSGKTRFKVVNRQKINGVEQPATSKTFDTLTEAQNYIKAAQKNIVAKEPVKVPQRIVVFETKDSPITFNSLGDVLRWELDRRQNAHQRYSETSMGVFKMPLRYDIANVAISTLNIKHLENYCKDRIAQGAGPSTVLPEVRFITSAIRNAEDHLGLHFIDRKKLSFYITQLLDHGYVADSNQRERRFRDGEQDTLFATTKKYEASKAGKYPFAIFIALLIETCLRLSELFNLHVENIDFENNKMRIGNLKKTNRAQPAKIFEASLTPKAKQLFRELMAFYSISSGPLFPIKGDTFAKHFREITKLARIDDFRVHDLRREGVSQKFEQGYTPLHIAKLFTGHKDTSILENIYIELEANNQLKRMTTIETKTLTLDTELIKTNISESAWNEVAQALLRLKGQNSANKISQQLA